MAFHSLSVDMMEAMFPAFFTSFPFSSLDDCRAQWLILEVQVSVSCLRAVGTEGWENGNTTEVEQIWTPALRVLAACQLHKHLTVHN